MLLDLLTMKDVQIIGASSYIEDGMGGQTQVTSMTTLKSAVIYQNNSNKSFFSDRVNIKSSHVLVTAPGYHTWTRDDQQIVRGNEVFNIVGEPDDVMGQGEIMVIGLEKVI